MDSQSQAVVAKTPSCGQLWDLLVENTVCAHLSSWAAVTEGCSEVPQTQPRSQASGGGPGLSHSDSFRTWLVELNCLGSLGLSSLLCQKGLIVLPPYGYCDSGMGKS